MPWLQLSVTAPEEQTPFIEMLFETLGAYSVTLGDAGDQPVYEPAPGTEPIWQATTVTALFDPAVDLERLKLALNPAVEKYKAGPLKIERIEDQAWEVAWQKDYKPMCFGDRLWVGPAVEEDTEEYPIYLKMHPGLAFGTGTHQTTALCLEWLDELELYGKTVIDYGCGSGILAIAALKLGASAAIAIDCDQQAIESTLDHASKNGVLSRLTAQLPEDECRPAEVMVANILAGTLIELAPQLNRLVKHQGMIALSGILQDQAASVSDAFSPYFTMNKPRHKDDWVLLSGMKTGVAPI